MAEEAKKPVEKVENTKAEEVKKPVFDANEAFSRANETLLNTPEAATLELFKDDAGKHYYDFVDNSAAAKKARKELKKILTEIWYHGAWNYDQFARKLRVQSLDIQGLIDEEFIRKNLRGIE